MKCNALVTILLFITSSILANDPTQGIPWPVGSIAYMNDAKTLMNTYGGRGDDWGDSFHSGIDIDANSEASYGHQVRCVEDGIVAARQPNAGDSGYYVVVIPYAGATNGWCYGHLDNSTINFNEGDPIQEGDWIGDMIEIGAMTQHLHFSWVDKNYVNVCLENPLYYLDEEPEGSSYWQFNAEAYSPEYEYKFLILPEKYSSEWTGWSIAEVETLQLSQNCIEGDVDLFFGVTLRGVGMGSFDPDFSRNCAPERVYWELSREEVSGSNSLFSKYVVNFDCPLDVNDNTSMTYYFRHLMEGLFNNNDAPLICLTNCGDMQGWENLGISNIQENSWFTNMHYNQIPREETINPILAEYMDGNYSIDVTCFAHVNDVLPNPDPPVQFARSIGCELHNFQPALREVFIIGQEPVVTYYHGTWIPDASGLEAILDIDPNSAAPAGADLEITLVFTEEMNTSSINVSLGPLDVTGGTWSGTVVDNDTWTGTVMLPSGQIDGSYILSVSAEDTDGNNLMNPEGEGTVPGPSYDTHHSLSIGFETGLEWTVSVHDQVLGSPKLADVNQNGDLEIVIQSADGWVDVLDCTGNSLPGWPVDNFWTAGNPPVTASPAVVNITGAPSSDLEIAAVVKSGCYVLNSAGQVQWSALMPNQWAADSSPIFGDFDNNGDYEVVVGRQMKTGSFVGYTLVADDTDGTLLWMQNWGTDESVTATPTLVDIDGDGDLELIVITDLTNYPPNGPLTNGTVHCLDAYSNSSVWNTATGATEARGSVASGELVSGVGDTPEIVVVDKSGSTFNLRVLSGLTGYIHYTKSVSGCSSGGSGASIADVNGDGNNDIVISCSNGELYCWDGESGDPITGFPVNIGTWTDDGVSIADIDSDFQLELILAGKDGQLYAVNHDGTLAAGFPLSVSGCHALSGQPAIGDIDNDGKLEVIFGEENNSVLHCYEMGPNSANNYLPWPQFQHDAQNTGYFPTDDDPPAPPENLGGNLTIMGYKALVNLSWDLSPDDPDDVCAYRIYRTLLPYGSTDLIASVPPGTTAYFDGFRFYFNSKVLYYLTSWDGVSESSPSTGLGLHIQSLNLISAGCPTREIHASRTEQSLSSTAGISSNRSNCSILTDGLFNEPYSPSRAVECVEIDLGTIHQVENVSVIRNTPDGMNREETESLALCSYSLSTDGNSFTRRETGAARYVRVYGAAGATEIEVYGSSDAETSSVLIDVVRNDSGAFTAQSVNGEELTLQVFDLMGRTIWQGTSVDQVSWPSVNSSGNRVPAGVYLLRVESESMETLTTKVVVR